MATSLARPIFQLQQIGTIVALAATVSINALANLLPLNGQTTAAISDRYPLLITPPGYVFAIWGLIYTGLIGYAIYQALPEQASNPRLRAAAPWFWLSCAGNSAWLLFWHYNFPILSFPAMATVLIGLIGVYLNLRSSDTITKGERWLVRPAFSLYLGWICVATLVNGGVLLYELGWQDTGIEGIVSTIVLLALAAGLSWWFAQRWRDGVLPLVVAWAASGIALKQAAIAPLAAVAWGVAGVAIAATVRVVLSRAFARHA
ncbi:MAG: tryptophan-rich sensory protein [Chloroflexus sp.]|uniref:TspO/MBR family protein n=1 Tax=Chloroflexus sp. TaxID=1904827 RepID=UPI0021DCFE97|nr:TspO/MBR family protein [Chloroflexus sp.]GIV89956.1 MAG: tryptophan-rich sensory protein [Chloroflexus sp.]